MDFKEIKKQIIDEINSKIVSLITHSTFKDYIFRESFEYKIIFKEPDFSHFVVKNKVLHLPLKLIIDENNKHAERYINHVITFHAYSFYKIHNGNANAEEFFEIGGPNWRYGFQCSPLTSRTVETLMAMNLVLKNYNEICQHREEITMKFISNFESNISTYFQLSKHNFCKIKTATKNADMGGIDITYNVLEINPYHPQFGKFREDYSLKKCIHFDEISKINLISEEEINDYLVKSIDDEISKYEKEIKKAEEQICNFNVSINLLKNLKTTI